MKETERKKHLSYPKNEWPYWDAPELIQTLINEEVAYREHMVWLEENGYDVSGATPREYREPIPEVNTDSDSSPEFHWN